MGKHLKITKFEEDKMAKYVTTKKECESKLNGRVCTRCGIPIVAIETVDNSHHPTFWAGCNKCSCFDNGVKIEIYKVAVMLVDDCRYIAYSHLSESDYEGQEKYWRHQQIGGACSTVLDVLRCMKKTGYEINNELG